MIGVVLDLDDLIEGDLNAVVGPGSRFVPAVEIDRIDVFDARDAMNASGDFAGVERLPEGPAIGMEKAGTPIGRIAGGEFLLEYVADILLP